MLHHLYFIAEQDVIDSNKVHKSEKKRRNQMNLEEIGENQLLSYIQGFHS
jgi:hypothetical protein